MSDQLYAAVEARHRRRARLRSRGLEPAVAPLRRVAPGYAAAGGADGAAGGRAHRARLSPPPEPRARRHRGVPGAAAAEIVAKLPALRAVAALLPAPEVRLTVLDTPAGLDVAAEAGGQGAQTPGPRRAPAERRLAERWASIATQHGLARLTVDGETVVELRAPPAEDGRGGRCRPAGGLRAGRAAVGGDHARAGGGRARGAPRPKRVADLFCGVGPFTLALARRARVLALDSDAAAIAALAAAARHAHGLKPIEAKVRDLFREPLTARELEPFDAVVLDPPRAGAQAQARELARSRVEHGRRRLVRSGHAGPRRTNPDGRRLCHRKRHADRSVRLLGARGDGSRAEDAEPRERAEEAGTWPERSGRQRTARRPPVDQLISAR